MHLKKNLTMMLITLLLFITLLSSVGGGIRYRENFLDEVFGDIDDQLAMTNPFEPNIQKQPTHAVKPLFKAEVRRPEPVVEEEFIRSSENMIVKERIAPKTTNSIKSNVFAQISGFDGGMYASI